MAASKGIMWHYLTFRNINLATGVRMKENRLKEDKSGSRLLAQGILANTREFWRQRNVDIETCNLALTYFLEPSSEPQLSFALYSHSNQ